MGTIDHGWDPAWSMIQSVQILLATIENVFPVRNMGFCFPIIIYWYSMPSSLVLHSERHLLIIAWETIHVNFRLKIRESDFHISFSLVLQIPLYHWELQTMRKQRLRFHLSIEAYKKYNVGSLWSSSSVVSMLSSTGFLDSILHRLPKSLIHVVKPS